MHVSASTPRQCSFVTIYIYIYIEGNKKKFVSPQVAKPAYKSLSLFIFSEIHCYYGP